MREVTGFVIAGLFCAAVAAESAVPVIPVVPAAKAKADLPQAPRPNPSAHPSAPLSEPSGEMLKAPSRVALEPGVNEIIPVAVSHLNRIVTPYEAPLITTSSPATTEVRDNVIYIATDHEAPLTLFVTEKGSEEQALSLTLIPRKIPPREIFLSLKGASVASAAPSTRRAEKWEQAQPYIKTVEELFRTLALGQLPPGYSFAEAPQGELPACRQTGLSFDFARGQTVVGHNLRVHIGTAHNTSPHAVEFAEDSCGDWDIAAVAAFPHNALEPDERTEIYVAQKRNYQREIAVKRPSLLLQGR